MASEGRAFDFSSLQFFFLFDFPFRVSIHRIPTLFLLISAKSAFSMSKVYVCAQPHHSHFLLVFPPFLTL